MSQIKIVNSSLVELATLAVVSSSVRSEKLNSDNTLNFDLLIRNAASVYINDTNCIKLGSDYFDIACYKKEQQSGGRMLVSVECEHVSYRLNDPAYDKEYFTEIGTPTYILGQILAGTGFNIGTVEFSTPVTYSAQEKKSRRQILMEFVATLEGEVQFDAFEISIQEHRGNATPQELIVGQHINVISKTVNKRQKDKAGNHLISYACDVINSLTNPLTLALGDEITLDYDSLDIDATLRIVSITTDPYNSRRVSIEIGNYVNALEDSLYRIQTTTVSKDKVYNGCRIGPTYGFESVLSDNMARSFFNSTAFKMQKGDGSGNNWVDVLYFDPVNGEYVFLGTITADQIKTGILSSLTGNISINLDDDVLGIGNAAARMYFNSTVFALQKYETDTWVDVLSFDISAQTFKFEGIVSVGGCTIDPTAGFAYTLADKTARVFFDGTSIKMQTGDGGGVNWVDVLYFDAVTGTYKFTGDLEVMLASKMARTLISGSEFKMQTGDGTGNNWVDSLYFDAVNNRYKLIGDIEVMLASKMARTLLNGSELKMQKGDGTGGNWVDVLYFDAVAGEWKFTGTVRIDQLSGLNVANPIIYLFTHGGTARAGSDGTITLATTASATDDTYIGMTITITDGTGAGQTRSIIDYSGSVRIAYTDTNWDTNPDTSSKYIIKGPALDATANNEQGIGQEMRFKWNLYNYLRYGVDRADFYFSDDNDGIRPNVRPDGFYMGDYQIGVGFQLKFVD